MITLLASGGVMLLLDQGSKRFATFHLAAGGLSWGPILRLRYVRHCDESYTRGVGRTLLVLTWLLALFAAVVLHRFGGWFQAPTALLGLGLAFGGAAGNLLDILRCRGVVDFIDLRWWPVFNLADLAIVAGLVAAFWG